MIRSRGLSNLGVFKSGSILALGQLVVAVCTFGRNIIVARLVSVEDFGIAMTFALTMSLFEMSTNLSAKTMLIQDQDGASLGMLGSAHAIGAIKGVLVACLIYSLATYIALIFDRPELAWAFQLLALVPLIRGFAHLDVHVMQREMEFSPSVLVEVLPHVVAFASAYFVARWTGDYRAILFLLILHAICMTLLSHLRARRPYRWVFDKHLAIKIFRFGFPLLLNGCLLFLAFQGDRFLVASTYDLEVLGWYSAAFAMTLFPSLMVAKVIGTLLLPIHSRAIKDPAYFNQVAKLSSVFCASVGVFLTVLFSFGGDAVINVSFGEKYSEGARVIVLLAVMQSLRIIRLAPTIVAIAKGQTKKPFYANLVRTSALVLAAYAAVLGYPVEVIVVCGIIGEGLALVYAAAVVSLGVNKSAYIVRQLFYVGITFAFYFLSSQYSLWYPTPGDGLFADQLYLVLKSSLIAMLAAACVAITSDEVRSRLRLAGS